QPPGLGTDDVGHADTLPAGLGADLQQQSALGHRVPVALPDREAGAVGPEALGDLPPVHRPGKPGGPGLARHDGLPARGPGHAFGQQLDGHGTGLRAFPGSGWPSLLDKRCSNQAPTAALASGKGASSWPRSMKNWRRSSRVRFTTVPGVLGSAGVARSLAALSTAIPAAVINWVKVASLILPGTSSRH